MDTMYVPGVVRSDGETVGMDSPVPSLVKAMAVGLREVLGGKRPTSPFGAIEAVRVTVPANPLRLERSIDDVPGVPDTLEIVRELGLALILKSWT